MAGPALMVWLKLNEVRSALPTVVRPLAKAKLPVPWEVVWVPLMM